ncbi:MAG: hypothetical protein V3V31_14515 [Methylococcales bacterium]
MNIKPVARPQPLRKVEESLQKDGKRGQQRRKPSQKNKPSQSDEHHRLDVYA